MRWRWAPVLVGCERHRRALMRSGSTLMTITSSIKPKLAGLSMRFLLAKCLDCPSYWLEPQTGLAYFPFVFSRKLSSLDRLCECRPFFLTEGARQKPTVAALILHASWFTNTDSPILRSLFLYLYIYLPRHFYVGMSINQVWLVLCVYMCVCVLIFITIHISRPV